MGSDKPAPGSGNAAEGSDNAAEGSDNAVTRLLTEWTEGEQSALEELLPLVYDELHRLAERQMRRERQGHTLQPTALVHEAYLKMVGQRRADWKNRAQFFAVSARVMRRILVDHARARGYQKRGGGAQRVTLEEDVAVAHSRDIELLALDAALAKFAELDPRKARVVELRIFGGMTIDETAIALGVSTGTVIHDYAVARAWLYRELDSTSDR